MSGSVLLIGAVTQIHNSAAVNFPADGLRGRGVAEAGVKEFPCRHVAPSGGAAAEHDDKEASTAPFCRDDDVVAGTDGKARLEPVHAFFTEEGICGREGAPSVLGETLGMNSEGAGVA